VVGFQMGAKFPPGAEPIPRLRPDLYGRFTVNLGVAVREAWEQSMRFDKSFPAFVNDYDCQIRERLGQVLGERHDVWWPLDGEPADTAAVISEALTGLGLAWLTARGTRRAILEAWECGGLDALPTPTALPIVMILRHLDRPDDAADVLRSYYDTITDHRPHRRHVYEVARSLHIGGLPPP